MGTLPFFAIFLPGAAVAVGTHAGGWWVLTGVFVTFCAIPIADSLMGINRRNPDDDRPRPKRTAYDFPLWLWVVAQISLVGWLTVRVGSGAFTAWEAVGVAVSLGLVTGAAGITVAHELVHRPHAFERALAEILMASVSYTHFCIEHIHGHHRNVSTPLDPATGRLGETFYRFYLRCVPDAWRSAWRIESERVKRAGISPFDLRDRRTRYLLTLGILYLGIGTLFGPAALAFFIAQGIVGFSILELVNYIEHYGLKRREISPGRFEKVRPEHSWNASHRLSNWLLFNLSRHSDHHYMASRPYDRLRHHDDVPQLPAGYATMILLALIPPLWMRVMNARVDAWNARYGTTEPSESPGVA